MIVSSTGESIVARFEFPNETISSTYYFHSYDSEGHKVYYEVDEGSI